MAKGKKEKSLKRGKYDQKIVVNGSFLDTMKAAAKDAKNKIAKKSS